MWTSIWKNVCLLFIFFVLNEKDNLFFLFYYSCIEKWLRTSDKCPQCQTTVKRKDLRRIYCRALHVLDTSERDNAIKERDLEKKARKKIAYEKAELQLAYDIIKDQLKRLQTEHERLLKYFNILFSFQKKKQHYISLLIYIYI